MKDLKPIQILTQESILEIKRAIGFLEVYSDKFPSPLVADNIEKLKAIIKDCES